MKTALAFDVYGTLIDTAGVVSRLTDVVGSDARAFSDLWRDKQLEYSFRRALMQRYRDFSVCVSESLDYCAARFAVTLTREVRQSLLDAFSILPAFDDARACLDEFDASGLDAGEFDLYALSNGSRNAVERLLESAGLSDRFIDIVSVEEIKTFKPDPAVYQHFLKRAGVSAEQAWLISGNPFDVIGALSVGMRAAWVKRMPEAVYDPWDIDPTITVSGLDELKARMTSRR
jgi:2-haloacid dehalogenase